MQEVKEYLSDMMGVARRRAVQKIKELEINYEQGVYGVLQTILYHLRKGREVNVEGIPVESCKLTALSVACGKHVLMDQGHYLEAEHVGRCIDIGDLYLEAFYELGYIDIMRNGKTLNDIEHSNGRDPWIVKRGLEMEQAEEQLTEEEVLAACCANTSFEPIPPITELYQANNRPIIKHWSKLRDDEFKTYLNEPFVKAIDRLQSTAWEIDADILEVVKSNSSMFFKDEEIEDKKLKESNDSKRSSYKWSIRKAEAFVGKPFWQYLDADYRGRLYYREPFLNYQGKDLERGLLKFNKAREMTEEGLFYLAVHTASSFNQSYHIKQIPSWCSADYKTYLDSEGLSSISVDKMTLEDRAQWTVQNQDMIIEAWEQRKMYDCEKPTVFLACCKEWHALRLSSSEGGVYLTNLPIPVDGSNNGWQHLAAISKDPQAGELVGLVPVEIQRDFYVQTAKELIARMPDWFEARQIPMKHIRKGISKRGSMTRAYSAGKLAIAKNMLADCHQEGFIRKYKIDMDDCMTLSGNLIQAINTVCPGPLLTMSFLQNMASYIIKSDDKISWTTPSGFPVCYEKYVEKDMKWKSWISRRRIEHVYKEPKKRLNQETGIWEAIPSPGKYASGISPNFIHSMDAAHMALVIVNFGQDFAAVHDSFSSHAGSVGELLDYTKETFISMYNHDDYFQVIKEIFLDEPDLFHYDYELGDLEVEKIRESDYFFA